MSSYTEHVTRVLTEDLDHPALGTVAVLTLAPPEGEERRPATLGPQSIEAVTGAIDAALDRAEAGRSARSPSPAPAASSSPAPTSRCSPTRRPPAASPP